MRRAPSSVGFASLLLVACASTVPRPEHAALEGSADTPVSRRKHFELTSVADELKYEQPAAVWSAAKDTGYHECLLSLDCTYCRKVEGWWVRRSCE